ncbi:TetR/AcrR family transcriptional regulator [Mangrovicoccus algicola]|uniref:Helix-turn-helix transcriptional regulator n=1 Tax=Mangrovicoccus algicola TaxID=2771008 RepID=A0A8J6Z493_9RHOB|nr:TetR/AcrR family transcriptional regulator [Mangrovicoccus algicola]MBE3637254.1 helix-turn-helix transcriptional regulator [Mangrovicoccus algicola]
MTSFIEKGFARATTADIAQRGGLSKRDVYRAFPDKTDLFTAAILSRRHLILDLPRPAREERPVLETLRQIFRLDLEDRDAAERDALMNLVARESLLLPELNALLYDTGIIRSRELLIDWLAAQMDRGAMPRHDASDLAGMMMDVVFGALLPRRRPHGPVDRRSQADQITARLGIVLAGIGQPREDAD